VRAFGGEPLEIKKFDKENNAFRLLAYNMVRKMAVFWSLSDSLCLAQILITLFFGIKFTLSSAITIGELMVFLSYVGMLVWPVRNLGRIISEISKMHVAAKRIHEILKVPPEQDSAAALTPSLAGNIVFSNVSFHYSSKSLADGADPVLNNLSLNIKQGETVGFLGSMGAGKSALPALLTRLYDYQSGSITINGTEIVNIKRSHLAERIGVVLQEPFLYARTVMENIKMGNPLATDQEAMFAAKIAHIHDNIIAFKDGYNTIVGERGVTLSGGQKSRLSLARALLKPSEILILDDALSAVDTETDRIIRNALQTYKRGVTKLIISQRITSVMDCDRIFVLDAGCLKDYGTHQELLTRGGPYARLYNQAIHTLT
jgi:ATP-binding cassette subfamily B protein